MSVGCGVLDVPCVQINLDNKTLEYYEQGRLISTYSVAIGKPNSPTPVGNFYVYEKSNRTGWGNKDGSEIPYNSPANPMLGIYAGIAIIDDLPLGIHATNQPHTVGRAASGGCIRLHLADMQDLYGKLTIGIPVLIRR